MKNIDGATKREVYDRWPRGESMRSIGESLGINAQRIPISRIIAQTKNVLGREALQREGRTVATESRATVSAASTLRRFKLNSHSCRCQLHFG